MIGVVEENVVAVLRLVFVLALVVGGVVLAVWLEVLV